MHCSISPTESKVQDPSSFLPQMRIGKNGPQERPRVLISNISPAETDMSQHSRLPVLPPNSNNRRGKESSTPITMSSIGGGKREPVQKQCATAVLIRTAVGDRVQEKCKSPTDKNSGGEEKNRKKEKESDRTRQEVRGREDRWLKHSRLHPSIQYFPLLPLYDINATKDSPCNPMDVKESGADEGVLSGIPEDDTATEGGIKIKKKKKTFDQYTAELDDMQAQRDRDKERDEGIRRNENNNKYYTIIPHDKDALDDALDNSVDVLNCDKKNKYSSKRERESSTVCNSNGHLVCCDLRLVRIHANAMQHNKVQHISTNKSALLQHITL